MGVILVDCVWLNCTGELARAKQVDRCEWSGLRNTWTFSLLHGTVAALDHTRYFFTFDREEFHTMLPKKPLSCPWVAPTNQTLRKYRWCSGEICNHCCLGRRHSIISTRSAAQVMSTHPTITYVGRACVIPRLVDPTNELFSNTKSKSNFGAN